MYSTTQLLGATVLIVASTAQAQTPERALMSNTPASYSIAGTLSSTATRRVEVPAAFRITGQRALLREVDNRARPAEPANVTDPPIDGSRALMGKGPAALPVAPRGVEGRSSFRAEVRGAVATSASGDAEFGAAQNTDRSPGAFVVSLGVCSDQGAMLFTRRNGTPLGVGRYRISEPADGADEILALVLTGSATRPTGVFRGQSGWLIVTAASDRLLTGWFQVDAIGFLAAEPQKEDRRVRATGSFSAAAASSSFRLCEDVEGPPERMSSADPAERRTDSANPADSPGAVQPRIGRQGRHADVAHRTVGRRWPLSSTRSCAKRSRVIPDDA